MRVRLAHLPVEAALRSKDTCPPSRRTSMVVEPVRKELMDLGELELGTCWGFVGNLDQGLGYVRPCNPLDR